MDGNYRVGIDWRVRVVAEFWSTIEELIMRVLVDQCSIVTIVTVIEDKIIGRPVPVYSEASL